MTRLGVYNLLGLLHATDRDLVIFTFTGMETSDSVMEWGCLERLIEHIP